MSTISQLLKEYLSIAASLLRWLIVLLPLGIIIGAACAGFLSLLDFVTNLRWQNEGLLLLLPLSGAVVAILYQQFGNGAEGGNNLIMDEIHEPGAGGSGVPAKLAPLVLIGTLLTHLCGGSAGREGTAVQMGGSIASLYSRTIRRFTSWIDSSGNNRTLLMCGVAAGFSGVFGTPLAGAVFALEVPSLGRMSYSAAIPCLIAAIIADRTCAVLGIHHTNYLEFLNSVPPNLFDWALLGKVILAGAIFGLVSRFFSDLTHGLSAIFKSGISFPVLRPVAGGLLVICLVYLLRTKDFLGLGVTSLDPTAVTIVSSFSYGGAHTWSWLWKIVFTAVTLGAAFKGGEVTPLFFIGATLGNTLSHFLETPTPLFAALGFVAVFAGATNTPLACTIMAVELFGSNNILYFATACFMAYVCSGHSGIYLSQRIGSPKTEGIDLPPESSLRSVKELKKQRISSTKKRNLNRSIRKPGEKQI